jgi:membrane protein DedA with SNARE-associated domain
MLENLSANLTNPTLWIVVLVWTAIGVLNKLIYYEAGERSGKAALEKIHGYTKERADRFHSQYDRWGSSLLLLASIPVFGSVIAAMAGMDGVAVFAFIVLVVISSLVRNWLIILLAGGIVQLFQ